MKTWTLKGAIAAFAFLYVSAAPRLLGSEWLGGEGNWGSPVFWSDGVPNYPETATLIGGSIMVTNPGWVSGNLDIGAGQLTIDGGTLSVGWMSMDGAPVSAVNISGEESELVVNGDLHMGGGGQNYIYLANRGKMKISSAILEPVSGAPNIITVSTEAELDVQWEFRLYSGSELRVFSGGKVYADRANVGYGPLKGDSIVRVEGPESEFVLEGGGLNLDAGSELYVSGGGKVSSKGGVIATGFDQTDTTVALVNGEGSEWKSGGMWIVGGSQLTIENEGLVRSGAAFVTDYGYPGRPGVLVTGSNSRWIIQRGEDGDGRLSAEKFGDFLVESGGGLDTGELLIRSGTIQVSGSASTLIVRGHQDENEFYDGGQLTVENGALKIETKASGWAQNGTIGNGGLLVIDGADSSFVFEAGGEADPNLLFNHGTLNVGMGGWGTVRVESGALLAINSGYIGSATGGGSVFVGGQGSRVEAKTVEDTGGDVWQGNIFVGASGEGSLEVSDGGEVISQNLQIGTINPSGDRGNGVVIVTGTNSKLSVDVVELGGGAFQGGWMAVGNNGRGILNVMNSGTVSAFQIEVGMSDSLDRQGEGLVVVNGQGSSLEVGRYSEDHEEAFSAGIRVAAIGSGTGTVRIENYGSLRTSQLTIGTQGVVEVWGTDSRLEVAGKVLDFEWGSYLKGGDLTVQGRLLSAGDSDIEAWNLFIQGGDVWLGAGTDLTVHSERRITTEDDYYVGGGVFVNDGSMRLNGGKVASLFGQVGNGQVEDGRGGYTSNSADVVISGIGSRWEVKSILDTDDNAVLIVGRGGDGYVEVENGGEIYSEYAVIGQGMMFDEGYVRGRGEVQIDGPLSRWEVSSGMEVGRDGDGILTLTNGGMVSLEGGEGELFIAEEAGSTGVVNVGTGGFAGQMNVGTIAGGEGDATLHFNHSDTAYFGMSLEGSLKIVKSGTGTTVLFGDANYEGDTDVQEGKLVINGDFSETTGDVWIGEGAELGGNGRIGGNTTVAGTLMPGNSPGLLTFEGNLTMMETAKIVFELNGTGDGEYDQIFVGGTFGAGGTINLTLGYAAMVGDTFQIFLNGGYDFGSFNFLSNIPSDLQWDTTRLSSEGIVQVVPEPSTYILLFLAFGVIYWLSGRSLGKKCE